MARRLDAMARIRFDNAFTFGYSEREGTVAKKKIADDVPGDARNLAALRSIASR